MINSVRQILCDSNHRLPTIEWDASLHEAQLRMAALKVSDLVVMSVGTPIGTISEQELHKVQCMTLDAASCRVSEVMSLKLSRISTSTSIEEAMSISLHEQSRALVVVEGDRFVGVVSVNDLLTWLMRDQDALVRNFVSFAVDGRAASPPASDEQPQRHRPQLLATWLAPLPRSRALSRRDQRQQPDA